MSNEFRGRVTGDSFQIGKVHTLNVGGGSATGSSADPPEEEKPKTIHFAVGFALVVVIVLVGNACPSRAEDPALPVAGQGSRPVGVSDGAVAQKVADKLARCATEVVLEPATCPQSHPAYSPRNVRWELVGDPRDGMQVK